MRTRGILVPSVFAALAIFAAAACTHVLKAPTNVVSGYSGTSKINLGVGVAILPELMDAKWEFHYMGDTWRLPIGESLTRNSEEMAKQIFSSVVVKRVVSGDLIDGVDATLTPRLKSFEQSSGAFAWSDAVTTIVLEWTLKDSKGRMVWADTIRSDVVGHLGTAFTSTANTEERTDEAVAKVFRASFDEITRSPEIRKLAAQ